MPGNGDIVRSVYRALATGDEAALLAAFHADAAVEQPELNAERYRGHRGVLAWARRWRDGLRQLDLQAQTFVEADEQVVVLSRLVARGSAGELAEARLAHVWTLQHGIVLAVRLYHDWKAAMRAAGLRS